MRKRGIIKGSVITILSLLFYAKTGWKALFLMLAVSLIAYIGGLLVALFSENKRSIFVIFLSILVFIFIYFEGLPGKHTVGLSYYILMAMGYIIGAVNGNVKAIKNPIKIISAISFSPLMAEGPIGEADKISEEIWAVKSSDNPSYVPVRLRLMPAFYRFFYGLFKKLVIADRLAETVNYYTSFPLLSWNYLLGLFLYSVELIADFTGGIDMAIAICNLLNVNVPENFRHPLFATSLSNFWKRWHISLSGWFQRNVFYPLSVSLSESKLLSGKSRRTVSRVSVYTASIITWSLTGLWHGISIYYLFWGLANAGILLLSYELRDKYKAFHKRHKFADSRGYNLFMMIRTFIIVMFLRCFDLMAAASAKSGSLTSDYRALAISEIILLIIACLVCVLISACTAKKKERFTNPYSLVKSLSFPARLAILLAMVFVIIIFGAYGKDYDAKGFIYGNF